MSAASLSRQAEGLLAELDSRVADGAGRPRALRDARVVWLTATVCLAAHYVVGMRTGLGGQLGLSELGMKLWWIGSQWLFLAAVPAAVSFFGLGIDPLDLGCRLRDARGHLKIYVALGALALGINFAASFAPHFSGYYPIYKGASSSWANLVLWELLYASQFLTTEFFFRGFLLRTCERAMGSVSIFAMLAPYCLFHAAKPWPEFLASIVAGLVLGTLAMATRSIWGGVVVHVLVGVSMDALALVHTGRLPQALGPLSW